MRRGADVGGAGVEAAPAVRASAPSGVDRAPAPFGIYVHVPFCAVKCGYCAFTSRAGHDPAEHGLFLEGLRREVERHVRAGSTGGRAAETLYLGGGTPTFLASAELERLFATIREGFAIAPGAEVTAEANPESLTPEKAALLAALGVNRVSLGAQSFDRGLLGALGRAHGPEAIPRAAGNARAAGITNLNLDLMFGLPGQSLRVFGESLERAVDLAPAHLSAYCLSFEPGTPFGERARAGALAHDEDGERDQYDLAVRRLAEAGYEHYEISSFARPGRTSRHNRLYWEGGDWLGLGPSAHSRIGRRKAANPADLAVYAGARPGPGTRPAWRETPEPEDLFERFFLGLRTARGIRRADFEGAWGAALEAVFPGVFQEFRTRGQIRERGERVTLDPEHWFVSDEILSELYAAYREPEARGSCIRR